MKLIVNPHKIEIDKSPVNEKEINITKCEFEFADEITNEYVKEAYFTLEGETYKQIVVNNQCDIPSEVLVKKGTVEIGVVAFLVENETEIKRYNPSPAYFDTWIGSLKDAENSEPITPSDKEQIEQLVSEIVIQMDNFDVDAEKTNKTTTLTITKKDGTQKTVLVEDGLDGVSLNYNWSGTSLGIKREDEQNYDYVNLKGDKGEPGAIKMIIVNELPATGQDDTIYLVPLATPESQENNYAEYVYINGAWELLGKIGIQVDLTDYALKSELPTALSQLTDDSTHRLVTDTEKTTWNGKANVSDIPDVSNFITKNVDDLTYYYNKTYIDNLVGDIDTALDSINGEVVS